MYQKRNTITQPTDLTLILLYVAIALIGLLCIFSVEYRGNEDVVKSFFAFKKNYSKQFIYLLACSVIATFILLMDSKFFTATPNLLYIFGILLMIATFAVGKTVNGSKSWIPLGFMNLQPVETCKIFTALALAKYLSRSETQFSKPNAQLIASGICFLPVLFCLLQNETGLALVYFSFLLPMYREGFPPVYLIIGASLGVLLVSALLFTTMQLVVVISLLIIAVIYFLKRKFKRHKNLLISLIAIWLLSIFFVGAVVPFLFKNVFTPIMGNSPVCF